MFKIGDMIIYSVHGMCEVEDIVERTHRDVTRKYYVLHPLQDPQLTIYSPVDNDKVIMLKPLEKDEAEVILQSFENPGVPWIKDVKQRNRKYQQLIKNGDRKEIADIANTLMRKEFENKERSKKLYDQDQKLLNRIQGILFKELSMTLDTSYENIIKKVEDLIKASESTIVK